MSTITHISSREFNQNTSEAKKAARLGPVIITDRGEPAHVLLSFDEYRRLTGGTSSIVDLLAIDDPDVAELEIPELREIAKGAQLE